MKLIVLYIVLSFGFLLTSEEVSGQKTSIDLLPSAHQSVPQETLVDTSFSKDTLVMVSEQGPSQIIKRKDRWRFFRKGKKNTGSPLDSLIHRNAFKNEQEETKTIGRVLFVKTFNPLSFIIYITALNI